MDYQQRLEAEKFAPIVTQRISAVDTDDWFRIKYFPQLGTGAAAATVALVEGGAMTFLIDGAAPTGTIDNLGTAGVIDTSAAGYDTVGELCDYINGAGGGWRMIMHGAISSDLMAKAQDKGAASAMTKTGLTFYPDSLAAGGATEYYSIAITGEHFTSGGHIKDWDEQCLNQLMSFDATVNMASAGQILIYEAKQGNIVATLLHTLALADNTQLVKHQDYLQQVYCEAHPGYRLIVRASHATDIAAAPTEFVVRGRTIVQSNKHIITAANYA